MNEWRLAAHVKGQGGLRLGGLPAAEPLEALRRGAQEFFGRLRPRLEQLAQVPAVAPQALKAYSVICHLTHHIV